MILWMVAKSKKRVGRWFVPPVRIRAIQGHRAFLVEQSGKGSMIKTMYTFDPDFDPAKVDDPTVHPAFSARPEGSPSWDEFPRVIYHTCDQAAFLSIIRYGLVPGGFPTRPAVLTISSIRRHLGRSR